MYIYIIFKTKHKSIKQLKTQPISGGKENFANLPDSSCQSFTKICPKFNTKEIFNLRDKGNTITLNPYSSQDFKKRYFFGKAVCIR